MRKALILVLSVLTLAGCVGIPTSGGVMTGGIIDDQGDPDLIVLPSAPRAGSSQEDILTDFMRAMRGPQSGYAIARQYLSVDIADSWNPDENAIIRTGIPAITAGATKNTLSYTFTSRAVVDSNFMYRETAPAEQTLEYAFVEEDGEWRISVAPDTIILSQSSFDDVFTEQALYFFDPSYQYLIPDVRWFPARATVTSRIVRELLEGPAAWLQQGVVVTAFPTATTVETSEIVSGTATVELSTEALTASATDRDRMRQQLAASLDVANVEMTVGGLELIVPSNGVAATRNPLVEGAVLVGTGEEFGFDTGEGIAPLPDISGQVVASGATAATLGSDKQNAAILTPGGVARASLGSSEAVILDPRPGLIAPSIDPFRFIWSAQGASAASLKVFGLDGTEYTISSSLPADARVVSIDVSRDGTRLLVYLSTPLGSRLSVLGIIRQQDTNVPVGLGEPFDLPVSGSAPVDATWVSDRLVATVSRGSEASPITLVEIGGPSTSLSQVDNATAIAGGNAGTDGLRVLAPDGSIWQLRGSGGWVSTGLNASFIGTKQ